jgi:hypothetical protein
MSQLIATAITQVNFEYVARPLLASPRLEERHARQLMATLVRHERASINGYDEGLKSAYISMWLLTRSIAKNPQKALELLTRDAKAANFTLPRDKISQIEAWQDDMKTMTPAKRNVVNRKVVGYFQNLLALERLPAAERLAKEPPPTQVDDGSSYGKIVMYLLPPTSTLAQSEARVEVQTRAYECLVAIRLWKFSKRPLPSDLSVITKAAGLPRVPVDSYSGTPLRMAIIDREPVIYSIGKDGRDDGGRVDSFYDSKPGDQIFRLPAPQALKP